MPVPPPNLYPPFNIVRISHVSLGVSDIDAARRFYVDTLGLKITHEEPDRLYLRALEERGHHSLILTHTAAPTVHKRRTGASSA